MILLGATGQCCAGFYNFQGRPGEVCLSILLLTLRTYTVFAAFFDWFRAGLQRMYSRIKRRSPDHCACVPWALLCSANFCFPLLLSITQCLGTDVSRSRAANRWFYCAQVPTAALARVNLNYRLRFQVCCGGLLSIGQNADWMPQCRIHQVHQAETRCKCIILHI
jgi:hypothetical protein